MVPCVLPSRVGSPGPILSFHHAMNVQCLLRAHCVQTAVGRPEDRATNIWLPMSFCGIWASVMNTEDFCNQHSRDFPFLQTGDSHGDDRTSHEPQTRPTPLPSSARRPPVPPLTSLDPSHDTTLPTSFLGHGKQL